jgi:hypothetical protein
MKRKAWLAAGWLAFAACVVAISAIGVTYKDAVSIYKVYTDEISAATFKLGGDPINGTPSTTVSATAAQLNTLYGVTGGTVTASKALVVDANSALDALRIDAIDSGASGTAGSLDVFPATASKGKFTISTTDNTADYTVTLKNAAHGQASTYTIGDCGNATGYVWSFLAAQTTAGVVKRADLYEDAITVHGITVDRLLGADLAELATSETAGDFYRETGSNIIEVLGEVSDDETETSVLWFQVVLPENYVAAGDVRIRVKNALIGAGTNNASTLDCEAYEQDGNGAVGADICATAAVSPTAAWATSDFVVTATGLVAGDILNVKITAAVIENDAGAGTLQIQLDGIAVLLDVKG